MIIAQCEGAMVRAAVQQAIATVGPEHARHAREVLRAAAERAGLDPADVELPPVH